MKKEYILKFLERNVYRMSSSVPVSSWLPEIYIGKQHVSLFRALLWAPGDRNNNNRTRF